MPGVMIRVLALGIVLGASATLNAQTLSKPECGQTDVDDSFSPNVAAKARDFVRTLQAAIRDGDKEKVVASVSFPLRVFVHGRTRSIKTREQLLKLYTTIISPSVKKAILDQNVNCLFAHEGEFMIGTGEIWSAPEDDGTMKIQSILSDPPR